MFSTTMIASSTTRPIARTSPHIVSVLIENPKAAIIANVATSETGIAIIGIDRGPEPLEEDEHDDQHQDERLDERVLDLGDVLADVAGRVVGDPVFQARRGSSSPARSISARTCLTMSRALASASW